MLQELAVTKLGSQVAKNKVNVIVPALTKWGALVHRSRVDVSNGFGTLPT